MDALRDFSFSPQTIGKFCKRSRGGVSTDHVSSASKNEKSPSFEVKGCLTWAQRSALSTDLRLTLRALGSHFGSTSIPSTLVTWLFVVFALAHFSFDAGMFDQFTKPFHSIVYVLIVTQTQLDHKFSQGGMLKAEKGRFRPDVLRKRIPDVRSFANSSPRELAQSDRFSWHGRRPASGAPALTLLPGASVSA